MIVTLIRMVIVQSSLTYLHSFNCVDRFFVGKEGIMVIKRVLTNNSVIVNENGVEKIVCGKGIAFKKKPGMEIDKSLINQTFILEKNRLTNIESLLKDIPMSYIEIAKEIIDMAKIQLGRPISDNVTITLADHIYSAAKRIKDGIEIHNSLLWEIQNYYELEYDIGKKGLDIIAKKIDLSFPDDEAGFIALHLVNAQFDQTNSDNTAYKVTRLIQEITTIVRYYFGLDFDTSDIYYYRFITHLKFFALRMFNGKKEENKENELFDVIKVKFKLAFDCAEKIKQFLMQKYHYNLSDDEILYLTIHIHRVITKSKDK